MSDSTRSQTGESAGGYRYEITMRQTADEPVTADSPPCLRTVPTSIISAIYCSPTKNKKIWNASHYLKGPQVRTPMDFCLRLGFLVLIYSSVTNGGLPTGLRLECSIEFSRPFPRQCGGEPGLIICAMLLPHGRGAETSNLPNSRLGGKETHNVLMVLRPTRSKQAARSPKSSSASPHSANILQRRRRRVG